MSALNETVDYMNHEIKGSVLGCTESERLEKMDEIRNSEIIMKIIGRYKDLAVSDIFQIKHFFNLLMANIFIYTRFQIMLTTFKSLESQRKNNPERYYNGLTVVNSNTDLFNVFANMA